MEMLHVYLLIGFAIFALIGLCVWLFQNTSSYAGPDLHPESETASKPEPEQEKEQEQEPKPEPEIESESDSEPEPTKATKKEVWCFVGEDLSGRYCVQVPSEKACTSNRVHRNRAECEMVAGSHMPAGIQREGVGFRSLASMNVLDDSLRNTDP